MADGGDGPNDEVAESENATDGSSPSEEEPAVYCPDVGPPCGLNVTFEPGGLALGEYSIEITTSAGVTSCDYAVEPERLQTPAEAEARDAMLAECASQGNCPAGPCTGPNTVYVRSDGLTIVEESMDVSIVIQELATGRVSAQSFAPAYADHPARTGDCSLCRVADGSMVISR